MSGRSRSPWQCGGGAMFGRWCTEAIVEGLWSKEKSRCRVSIIYIILLIRLYNAMANLAPCPPLLSMQPSLLSSPEKKSRWRGNHDSRGQVALVQHTKSIIFQGCDHGKTKTRGAPAGRYSTRLFDAFQRTPGRRSFPVLIFLPCARSPTRWS